MRQYLDAAGIPVAYDDRSLEEILNGERGADPGTPSNPSWRADYSEVDEDALEYLAEMMEIDGQEDSG